MSKRNSKQTKPTVQAKTALPPRLLVIGSRNKHDLLTLNIIGFEPACGATDNWAQALGRMGLVTT